MRLAAVSALLIALALAASPARSQGSAGAIVARTTAYLAEYQRQLSFLLADERTIQRVFDGAGRESARRETNGEFFVTFVVGLDAWMSVHDVSSVDGQPVERRADLTRRLQSEPLPGLARRLIQRNAQFNIGNVVRNFNEPTLALRVLEPRRRSRFEFDRTRPGGTDAGGLVSLAFEEKDGPTLVRSMTGRDVRSKGELTVEAQSGRIRRTSIRFDDGPVRAELATVYGYESKLDVWVPTTFSERYERTKDDRQLIVCETEYTNYRRFEATGRIR